MFSKHQLCVCTLQGLPSPLYAISLVVKPGQSIFLELFSSEIERNGLSNTHCLKIKLRWNFRFYLKSFYIGK